MGPLVDTGNMRMQNSRLIIYYVILIGTSMAGIAYGVFFSELYFPGHRDAWQHRCPVSYTHLTLPTNREG